MKSIIIFATKSYVTLGILFLVSCSGSKEYYDQYGILFDKKKLTLVGDYCGSKESIFFEGDVLKGYARLDNNDGDYINQSIYKYDVECPKIRYIIRKCSDTIFAKAMLKKELQKKYNIESYGTMVEVNNYLIEMNKNSTIVQNVVTPLFSKLNEHQKQELLRNGSLGQGMKIVDETVHESNRAVPFALIANRILNLLYPNELKVAKYEVDDDKLFDYNLVANDNYSSIENIPGSIINQLGITITKLEPSIKFQSTYIYHGER